MFLSIKNLGKIAAADIAIDGITVIAGENDTGKSTVGKTLFCIFNSFYQIDRQIYKEKFSSIINQISKNFGSYISLPAFEEIAKSIINKKDIYMNDVNLLIQYLKNLLIQSDSNFEKPFDKTELDKIANNFIRILSISDHEILIAILKNKMQSEFNMQINNLNYPEKTSEITLIIKEKEIKIYVTDNNNIDIFNNINLNTEVIYFDDPHIMDNPRETIYNNGHRAHLRTLLFKNKAISVIDEIIASKKLDVIFEKFNSVCPGEMILRNTTQRFVYKERESGNMIDATNMSAGLKTFAIIKTLLLNGSLEENGTIILDEPEIHLHPKWQLVFAEIIVLLQKEFNLHILINTHSPYFLDAIEVYSRKHGIAGKCKYYLAEISDNGMSVISDVSLDTEKIYKKLAEPFQKLEDDSYDY